MIKQDDRMTISIALQDYDKQMKNYHFYNWELAELERCEKEIKQVIEAYEDNISDLAQLVSDYPKITEYISVDKLEQIKNVISSKKEEEVFSNSNDDNSLTTEEAYAVNNQIQYKTQTKIGSDMKKIEFGFANDINPKGSWEGIGIKPGMLLTDAEFYGSIGFNGDNYIVAKVVEDEHNRYPQLLNKFIVRQALCDIYADGSAYIMLNQEETEITKQLENHLNDSQIINNIANLNDILKYINGIHRSSNAFILGELGDVIVTTSITPEVFEAKNNAIKSCHNTFSELQQELYNKYTK